MQVNPQFYAFRWITLLLTQEFPFPDAVRLWDTLLSDTGGRSNCLLRLCIAMLVNVRGEILQVQSIGFPVAFAVANGQPHTPLCMHCWMPLTAQCCKAS